MEVKEKSGTGTELFAQRPEGGSTNSTSLPRNVREMSLLTKVIQ